MSFIPNPAKPQLRLVEPPPPQHAPTLTVRIYARAGDDPFARSEIFELSHPAFYELIDYLLRLAARG
jgi:hypothetical protein